MTEIERERRRQRKGGGGTGEVKRCWDERERAQAAECSRAGECAPWARQRRQKPLREERVERCAIDSAARCQLQNRRHSPDGVRIRKYRLKAQV